MTKIDFKKLFKEKILQFNFLEIDSNIYLFVSAHSKKTNNQIKISTIKMNRNGQVLKVIENSCSSTKSFLCNTFRKSLLLIYEITFYSSVGASIYTYMYV